MTVRWGICATGGIAEKFVTGLGLVPDAQVVAVGSRTAESAEDFGERYGIPRRYGSYEELAADDDVDIIYVATPQNRHQADALLFLRSGRHVLCEKPFARSAAELHVVVEEARARNLFLMEAIWSRFLPSYVRLRELLQAGRIGEPRMVEANFGFRMPEVDPQHRLFDPHRAGGGLLDLGIYPVQLASMVLGTPDRVEAIGHLGETGVDEQTALLLGHADGSLALLSAAIRTSTTCGARISGTLGHITIPPFVHVPQSLEVNMANPDQPDEHLDLPMEGNGYHHQVLHVHQCLKAGKTESDILPLDESLDMMRTLDAARQGIGLVFPKETVSNDKGSA